MRLKKPIITLAIVLTFAAPASADVGGGMTNWFNSMGGFSNSTPPSSYKTQTMNGFSGGGLYVRSPVKNYQLMSATAPSLSIGCGGIDLTAGSFSYINKATLTAMLQNIGTSLGYAFLLAIKSSMPEMADLFQSLQSEASKINNANINSCQLTSGIPFKQGADFSTNFHAMVSHVEGAAQNIYDDSHDSRDHTKNDSGAQTNAETAAIAADPSKKNIYLPGNVVWKALNNNTSGLDMQDKLLIMSLTGTIIISPPSGTGTASKAPAWHYIEPTGIRVEDFIGYTDGSPDTFNIYTCGMDTVECLTPAPSSISSQTFITTVSTKIDSMIGAVNSRSSQNMNDFHLVDISSIPVWKMISLSASTQPDLVNKYKRFIAVDIAYAYFNNLLNTAHQAMKSGTTEPAAPDAQEALKQLNDHVANLRQELYAQRTLEYHNMQGAIETERELQMLHQAMVSGIPAQAFTSMSVIN